MDPEDYKRQLAEKGITEKEFLEQSFSRMLGLVTRQEQEVLVRKKVAIAGLGGVGGQHLITLIRLGFGSFHLAEYDHFEPVNVNRQYGAKVSAFGRSKLEVMLEEAWAVNPYARITSFPQALSEHNLDEFLQGVDLVMDGLDFFAVDIRRLLFQRSREKGIHVITAGPIGFSSALLIFAPDRGMDFDSYFGIFDGMPQVEKYLRFFTCLTPKATHFKYMHPESIKLEQRKGPSSIVGCQLCAAMACTEALRIALGRKGLRPAPHFAQFDAYTTKLKKGYLFRGYRNPWQKWKRNYVQQKILKIKDMALTEMPVLPGVMPKQGEPVSTEAMSYILRAGIQAPSGDNAQPWKFAVHGDQVQLFLDRSADQSFFNVQQLASIISCGAVLENMRVAASELGLAAKINLLPQGDESELMARVSFRAEGVQADPLRAALWQRCTNRKPYSKVNLEPDLQAKLLQSVSSMEGCSLHLLTAKHDLKKLAGLVYQADRIRTEHRALHEHLMNMIRFNEQEFYARRDGFPVKNLEAGKSGEIMLKIMRPWRVMNFFNKLGIGRMIAGIAYQGIIKSSAAALVTVDGVTIRDYLTGGQAMERFWLKASAHNLSLQPAAALPLFWTRWHLGHRDTFSLSHQQVLSRIWPEYQSLFPGVDFEKHGQVMLFRLGRGDDVTQRTLRRRTEDFCSVQRETKS